ncbi:hypothetical protein GCM10009801_42250 [Streptomyces albiaxialis]|uniref:DoxX family protein n=1 Tax=Streptomyces albiaxialis TaxID=329523 RepID=A0ABN2W6L1_9ACTN
MHAISALALASLLIGSGIAHFLVPRYFRGLVPDWVGHAGPVVAASGVADLVVGGALCVPGWREAGAWAAAVLITAYLPSHLDALRHARPAWALTRLVVNLAYIGGAVAVAMAA